MTVLESFYRGKTVLITGHTGFKGSWLALWLHNLGAKVVGYALDPPTDPSNFEASGLAGRIVDVRGDVCDVDALSAAYAAHHPDVVFHLAAQSLVRRSYREPRTTFETNVMGTVNVLDCALRTDAVRAVVSITTDKCYEEDRSGRAHREDDRLGGRDAYSGSKACAELVTSVYRDARFQRNTFPPRQTLLPISSVRAGNVIGGGDWAEDRLVPDVVRAAASGKDVVVRNPDAVRPWQHVLEPLSGYLWLAVLMTRDAERFASSYNFGPDNDDPAVAVGQIVESLLSEWNDASSRMVVQRDTSGAEAPVLRVDSTRARQQLEWCAAWPLPDALRHTASWYRRYYERKGSMFDYSLQQIHEYAHTAKTKGAAWAGGA